MPKMPSTHSSVPEEGRTGWTPEDSQLQEGYFYIRSPNNLSVRLCFTCFEEAMGRFAGFNLPYCKGDSFVQSVKRVMKYYEDNYNNQTTRLLNYSDEEERFRRLAETFESPSRSGHEAVQVGSEKADAGQLRG
jgi:hypothetical protein